jgi:MFS family permease
VTVVPGLEGVKVSWGGVWGGVLVSLAVLILLSALGVAIGVSAVDPTDTSAGAVGLGAAAWAGVSLLLSLFVGGLVAARIGATHDRITTTVEGVLVWIVTMLLMVYLAGSGVSLMATGAFNLVRGSAQAVTVAAAGTVPDIGEGTLDEVVARLRDPQTPRVLAVATGMPEPEVRAVLSGIADRAESANMDPAQTVTMVRDSVRNMVERARSNGRLAQAAENAQRTATKTAWVTLGALILSLLAAVLGAIAGRRPRAILMQAAVSVNR